MGTTLQLSGSMIATTVHLKHCPASDPSPRDILAELDILNQPKISISEIRAASATGHISPHLDMLHRTAREDTEY